MNASCRVYEPMDTNKNLLIVGAGTYAVVAFETATDMGCFEKIAFIDDKKTVTPAGHKVIGTICDIDRLAAEYGNIVVAIGNPEVRSSLLHRFKEETSYRIVSLISPRAYVSPSAKVTNGCIIEPMAVVHTDCVLGMGCIVSAGAVVNHVSTCGECAHVDCNATVEGYSNVPAKTKICCGTTYKNENR